MKFQLNRYYMHIAAVATLIIVAITGYFIFDSYHNIQQEKLDILLSIALLFVLILLFTLVYLMKKNREKLFNSLLEQHKIENEMMDAKRIQMGILPDDQVLKGLSEAIEIHGSLTTARIVGGDLYDYRYRDGKLIFCIGDVSGKGLSAAVYMTAVTAVFRLMATRFHSPSKIVSVINDAFVGYNSDCMFVTMIVGSLDCESGVLTYTNAGHNPPVIIKENGAGFVPLPKGTPVGFFKDAAYTELQLTLAPGEKILLYTDGVTEAHNEKGELFGGRRLKNVCSELYGKSLTEVVDCVSLAVDNFASKAEQADDITMLCISNNLKDTLN